MSATARNDGTRTRVSCGATHAMPTTHSRVCVCPGRKYNTRGWSDMERHGACARARTPLRSGVTTCTCARSCTPLRTTHVICEMMPSTPSPHSAALKTSGFSLALASVICAVMRARLKGKYQSEQQRTRVALASPSHRDVRTCPPAETMRSAVMHVAMMPKFTPEPCVPVAMAPATDWAEIEPRFVSASSYSLSSLCRVSNTNTCVEYIDTPH